MPRIRNSKKGACMREVYEGMRAVCAVLAELEARMPEAPALRLAERHLRLLAETLAVRPGAHPEAEGSRGTPLPAAAEGASHVRQ